MKRFLLGVIASSAFLTGVVLADSNFFHGPDVGPKADVAALRSAAHKTLPGETIGPVHVVADFALVTYYTPHGDGEGSPAFKRISGEQWKKILPGGETSMSVGALIQAGVPASVARKLCSGWGNPPDVKNLGPCMS